jgi:hypothetical protein
VNMVIVGLGNSFYAAFAKLAFALYFDAYEESRGDLPPVFDYFCFPRDFPFPLGLPPYASLIYVYLVLGDGGYS